MQDVSPEYPLIWWCIRTKIVMTVNVSSIKAKIIRVAPALVVAEWACRVSIYRVGLESSGHKFPTIEYF